MSEPGDKSDDLISELAKLMQTSPGASVPVKPVGNLAPMPPLTVVPEPSPATPNLRIPGMEGAAIAAAAPQPATISMPAEPPRAAATGTIRIPGMDQPAPVTTSAPAARFDFPKAPEAAPVIPVAAPRPVAPTPAPEPTRSAAPSMPLRMPSLDVKPVSENKSFGEGPAVLRPASPQPKAPEPVDDGGFKFDFGFGKQPDQKPANDPIAALIAAELESDTPPAFVLDPLPAPATKPEPSPAARSMSTPMAAPSKPSLPPLASTRAAPVPLRANPPPRPAESDRFAISPGMGFNGRQALNPQPVERMRAPEPEPQSDPMAEIESLIGEAVRVQLAPPGPVKVQATPPLSFRSEQQYVPEPQDEPEPEPMPVVQPQQYAPVVPPLTHFAPRRASIAEQSSDPAEEAILAASADSGMDIGRLDGPSVSEESPYRRLKVKPQRQTFMSGGMRQYVGMAIAGTLLLAAGLGLYWVLNMGRSGAGTDAPVLTADATPVKVAPVPEVQAEDATPASPVLQQLDGASTEPSVEQLVSTDETTGQDVARVVGAETAAPADESEGGLANRKVRTVTVRPDGTIVSGEDSVAGAEELPVDRPNVPELPGATENVDLLGADGTALATADAAVTAAEPLASIDTGTVPVNTAALDGTAAVATGGILDPSKVAPKPAGPPNRSAMLAAFQATTTAPAPLAAVDENTQDLFATDATPAAAPVTNSGGGAYVQLASSPSESDATSQARSMQSRFGSLFGGNTLRVVSADLGQKGVWYRVRLPVGSLSDANAICASIKANGGDCITGG